MYRELTTPAPGNPRQNHCFNPTPPPRFVPQIGGGVGFHVVFGIFGGGGGQVGVFRLVSEREVLEVMQRGGEGVRGRERERGD